MQGRHDWYETLTSTYNKLGLLHLEQTHASGLKRKMVTAPLLTCILMTYLEGKTPLKKVKEGRRK